MEKMMAGITKDSVLVLAVDQALPGKKDGETDFVRGYLVSTGEQFLSGNLDAFQSVTHHSILSDPALFEKAAADSNGKIIVVLYPTRTYSTGFAGNLFTDVAPEDRKVIRKIQKSFPGKVDHFKVPLSDTQFFEKIEGYFGGQAEREKYQTELKTYQVAEDVQQVKTKRFPIGFDLHFIRNVGPIFQSCMTRPNRQDFFYLVTKTFGINLIVRVLFAAKGVQQGDLPMMRAILSTSWYQLQDIVFTVFGQTYMKFLGKMTGMFRIGNAYIGDFLFVYFQFCFFEFLNRLILGPIGENPLVYTWSGLGLILLNNLQGLASGGPLVPAINKIRRSGAISHSMMMHMYQLGSLCFYFGLFASFGYQTIYALLTGGVMVFAWGSYILFSLLFKDPKFAKVQDATIRARLDSLAVAYYVAGRREAALVGQPLPGLVK